MRLLVGVLSTFLEHRTGDNGAIAYWVADRRKRALPRLGPTEDDHGCVTEKGRFVTHYHRADRRPFQSLSEVPDGDLDAVLANLVAGSRRRFGPRYLPLRRATELRARELFIRAGGQPVRQHPHYFVLGESPWFAGLYDDPREVRVPLDRLPVESTSFTWVDSITALGLGRGAGVPQPIEPWKRPHPGWTP